MNAIPIPDELAGRYPGFRRVVVAGPNGDLTNEGDSPEEAIAVEALVGPIQGWPAFIVFERLDTVEIDALRGGALLQLTFYVPQMPVHSIAVVPGITPAGAVSE